MNSPRRLILASGLLLGLNSLNGALLVESRHTLLQASTQFGYLGSVTLNTDSADYQSLVSDLQPQLSGSDSGSGSLGDTSWAANYEYRLEQSLEFLSAGIAASGSVSVFAFAGDQGVASVDATSGNQLHLVFSLDTAEACRFSGIIQDFTGITFERSLGAGSWTPVVEPGTGLFDYTLELQAGQYRLTGIGGGYHDASQGQGSSWSFQLVAVPEPASAAVTASSLLLGFAAWWRLRPKHRHGRP